MIDRNVDTKVWFKVMEQVEDLHNHKAYPRNRYYLPPISEAKGEIGYISLLTGFYFNE